jgi:DDB1- and CUL4-associated factor 13
MGQTDLLASTGGDRSVVLYDVRADSALRQVTLAMNANALAWNPREPLNFTVGCEDSHCYTFDMRKLSHALMVHKDHVGAVMDVHYSPTGREFVSGSYDRTIRIWRAAEGKSREVYHAKRMQRVFTVKYTMDARYVLSGSDDTNVRIWKAQASAPLQRLLPAERAHMDYAAALKGRFQHAPEVKRILT